MLLTQNTDSHDPPDSPNTLDPPDSPDSHDPHDSPDSHDQRRRAESGFLGGGWKVLFCAGDQNHSHNQAIFRIRWALVICSTQT